MTNAAGDPVAGATPGHSEWGFQSARATMAKSRATGFWDAPYQAIAPYCILVYCSLGCRRALVMSA